MGQLEENENKISIYKLILLYLFIFLLLLIPYRIIDWGFLNGEITSNLVLCKEEVVLGYCSHPDHTFPIGHYKVNAGRQEVIWWTEHDKTVEKLRDCVVKDNDNWSCKTADGYREIGYADSRYWTKSSSLETDR